MFSQEGPQIWVSFISLWSGIDHNSSNFWRSLQKNAQNIWPELNQENLTLPKMSNYPRGLSGLLCHFAPLLLLIWFLVTFYNNIQWFLSLTVCPHLPLFASLSSTRPHCSQLIRSSSNLTLPGPPSNCTLFNTPATCRYGSTYPASQTQQSCSI